MPLDPEIAELLERQKGMPPRASLNIAQTREMMRRGAALAGAVPAVARVEELTLARGLRAREYWPSAADGLPRVVYFHGGRFFSGDLESHDTVCRILALASGCRVVAVDYRLAPEHRYPAAEDDARAAVKWALREGVAVGVAGDSAGGYLAAAAAEGTRCQLLVYPMMDAACGSRSYAEFAEGYGPAAVDMKRGWDEYLDGAAWKAPALARVPALVMTAEYDTLREEGEAYAARLREAGATVEVQRYAGTIHGFFTMHGTLAVARAAMQDAARFLRNGLQMA